MLDDFVGQVEEEDPHHHNEHLLPGWSCWLSLSMRLV